MALLDFPSGPQNNDTYTLNGNTWKWNGTSWVAFNNLSLSSQVSGVLATQYGGTGKALSSLTVGSVLYADTASSFAALTPGTNNYVLATQGNGNPPYWKIDDSGTGSVGSGITGGFAYYTGLNTITSGSGFSYIAGSGVGGTIVLTNGLLALIGSTIVSGTWAGNAITLAYGGTNGTNSGIALSNQLAVYNLSGQGITQILSSAGTANSILLQADMTVVPRWVSQATLVVGGATTAAIASTAAYVVTDSSTAVRYIVGTPLNSASAGATLSTGSGVTIGNNSLSSGTIYVTSSTLSSSPTSGALVVTGGVGIGSSLWTSPSYFSSISGVGHSNGVITSGSWAGNAVTLLYGGTNGTNSGIGLSFQLAVYNSAGSAITQILSSAGTANSILLQSTQNVSPQWVAQSTLVVGGATTAAIASTAAYVVTDSSTAVRYIVGTPLNSASAGATLSTGSGVTIANNSLSSGTIYVTSSTLSSSPTSGALVVTGGVGIGSSLWTSPSYFTSISGVGHSNGVITSGSWAGNAVTLLYGGTNGTNSGIGLSFQLAVYNSAGNAITQILSTAGTANSILLQSSQNLPPQWVAQSTLSVGSATNATNLNITNDNTNASAQYLTWVSGTTSNQSFNVSSTKLTFVPNTGVLSATSFSGSGVNLTGIVTTLVANIGSGITLSGSGMVTISNSGVVSLTGTANQVLVNSSVGTATSGNITLTLPQSINTTSSPQFVDIVLSNGTNSTLASVGSQGTSLVNKQYVDNLASGLDIHGSVRVVATSAIGGSYVQFQAPGSSAVGASIIAAVNGSLPSIDGVTFVATGSTQRILVAGGATGRTNINGNATWGTPTNANLANGIYYVFDLGSAGSKWILVRATDTDDNTELTGGTFTFVEEGSTYADTGWVCTNDTTNYGPIQFGLDNSNTGAINFSQFSGAATFTTGQGLSKVGTTFATNLNIAAFGPLTGGVGYTSFIIGGAQSGVAGTASNTTLRVGAASTNGSGTAAIVINNTGFSMTGGTQNVKSLTVIDDITLSGGSSTLTLTGNISLPNPGAAGRVPYSSDANTVAFLAHPGAGYALTSVGSTVAWQQVSVLSVGFATTAPNAGFAGAATTASTAGLATSATSAGTAFTAAYVVTDSSTAVRYIVGTPLNSASAGATLSTGSGVTIGNNSLSSGTIFVTSTTPSSSISTGALVVTGGVGIGSSLWTSPSYFTSISGVGHSNGVITSGSWAGNAVTLLYGGTNGTNSGIGLSFQLAVYNSAGNAITQILSSAGTANSILLQSTQNVSPQWVAQSTLVVGGATTAAIASTAAYVVTDSSTAVRYIVGTPLNSASAGATLSTGSGVTIANNSLSSGTIYVTSSTLSSSTTSGALVVTGGVGIGSSLWTSPSYFSSISGVGHSNSVITSGSWAGNAVTLLYGGTNGTNSGIGLSFQLAVYNSAGNAITQILSSSGTANSILLQSTQNVPPQWVAQSTLVVGGATTAAIASTSAYVVTDSSTAVRYIVGTPLNTASAGATLSTGSGVTIANNSLSSGNIFVTNYAGYASTSNNALVVNGGVGIGGTLWTNNNFLASVSGVQFLNGLVTSGTWAGNAVTLTYGGTNNTIAGSGYSNKVAVYNGSGFGITAYTHTQGSVLIGAIGGTFAGLASTNLAVAAISDTPPSQPGGAIGGTQPGQLWWDSQYGVLKIYYTDGSVPATSQWVDATPVLGSSGGGSSVKRSYVMTFGAGFTPTLGADSVQIQVPYAPDNTSKFYYIKRLDYRNETLSGATGASFYIDRHTAGNAAFTPANRIHTAGSGAASSFVIGASTYATSWTLAATGASFVSSSGVAASIISGDYLRLNFTTVNSAASLSVSMLIEEQ